MARRPRNRSSRVKRSIRGNFWPTRSIDSTFADSFDSARLGPAVIDSIDFIDLSQVVSLPQCSRVPGRRYETIVIYMMTVVRSYNIGCSLHYFVVGLLLYRIKQEAQLLLW